MNAKMKEDGLMTMGKPKTKRPEKSKPDSERDSGFSDASSEHFSYIDHADREEAARGHGRSRSSQLAVIGGPFQNLSPMIFMNNVLLKQPGDNASSLKTWGFSPSVEVVQQPQVVFLQPVISQTSASDSKGTSRRRKHKRYLPILKSYPKIAPHPGDSPRSSCASTTSSSNSSVTASVKSGSSSSSWDPPHEYKQQSLQTVPLAESSPSNQIQHAKRIRHLPASPLPQTPVSDTNTGSCSGIEESANAPLELSTEPKDIQPLTSQTQLEAFSKDDADDQSGDSDGSKRKRFCNTYNILSKSGLLDITLRTKELIRQNRRTQAELDKLREQTNLFMEALQTGDMHIWSKLQLSLQEEKEGEKVVSTGLETPTHT